MDVALLEERLDFVQSSDVNFIYYYHKEFIIYLTFCAHDAVINVVKYGNLASLIPQQRVHNEYNAVLTALTKAGHPLAKGLLRYEKVRRVVD